MSSGTPSVYGHLPRSLGWQAGISVVVGSVIGSGIFMKPATMASQLGSPGLLLAVWVIAGCITLCGALSNAEVAAMIPETGGQYVFFRIMYGKFFAWLYGWSAFAVFNTAAVAGISYVFGTYASYIIPLPNFPDEVVNGVVWHIPFLGNLFPLANAGVKMVTLFTMLFFTWISYRSTASGGILLTFLTALKVLAIVGIVCLIFFSGQGDASHFFTHGNGSPLTGMALVGGVVAALSGAFWAFDGWNNITFVGGEIRDPQRNIPKSLIWGIILCLVIYLLINLAFLYAIPVDQMALSAMIATDATRIALGPAAAAIIALVVMLTTAGSIHGNVLSVARITYSMAHAREFFRMAGKTHPIFQTPSGALWLHAVWCAVFIVSGTFDILTDMVIFSTWFFYGMSALGIFILRKKMPDHPRPYRAWGYPFVPGLFVVFTFFFLGFTVFHDITGYMDGTIPFINSLAAILITLSGVPLYFYFTRRSKKQQAMD